MRGASETADTADRSDAAEAAASSGALALSVVVPAFQEEERLPATLTALSAYLDRSDASYEVVVVDDGSTDATTRVAKSFEGVRVLTFDENRGKGAAVRAGVLASFGSDVLISDADLSTPIEEIENLRPHLERAALVFGSRGLPSSTIAIRQPFYRQWMGKTFNRILRLFGVGGIRDTQCGFKLLRGEVARELFSEMTTDGFAFDVELVLRARARGYEIAEVGVVWRHAEASRVRLVRDSLGMLVEVLFMRLRGIGRRER